jgi:hypothetical protein
MILNMDRTTVSVPILGLLLAASCTGPMDPPVDPVTRVEREYPQPLEEVREALIGAVPELKFEVQEPRDKRRPLVLRAGRDLGDEIRCELVREESQGTWVSVIVGARDRALAATLHERLLERLALGTRPGGFQSEASRTGTYAPNVAECMDGARAALAKLRMTTTQEEIQATGAFPQGACGDTVQVTLRIVRTEGNQTQVTFAVRGEDTPEHRALAEKLRNEFELSLPRLRAEEPGRLTGSPR